MTEIAVHFTIVPIPCGEEFFPIEYRGVVDAMVEFVAHKASLPEHRAIVEKPFHAFQPGVVIARGENELRAGKQAVQLLIKKRHGQIAEGIMLFENVLGIVVSAGGLEFLAAPPGGVGAEAQGGKEGRKTENFGLGKEVDWEMH